MVSSFTKPDSLAKEIEALRFSAERVEQPGARVIVFESSAWTDESQEKWDSLTQNFDETLRLLGLDTVAKDRVKLLEYRYQGLSSGFNNSIPHIDGTVEIKKAMYQVAMEHACMADFPNDFTIKAEIRLSEGLDAVIEYRSEECGSVCEDCPAHEVLPGESCEHHEGESAVQTEYIITLETVAGSRAVTHQV